MPWLYRYPPLFHRSYRNDVFKRLYRTYSESRLHAGCMQEEKQKENCPTSDNCFYEVLSSRRQAVNCGILACCLPSIFRSRQLQPLSPCPPWPLLTSCHLSLTRAKSQLFLCRHVLFNSDRLLSDLGSLFFIIDSFSVKQTSHLPLPGV